MIKDIIEGKSPIKIYGQIHAKEQCLDALAGCIENIYAEIAGTKNPIERRGNVVYMIGPSGVGKTTMAKAIANALLKHSSHTQFFIDSSQINREQPLGEQLFKLINKTANLKDSMILSGDKKGENLGTYDAKVASPLLRHLYRWGGAIVVLDEFEKMKEICTPPEAPPEYADKSADEIIKSIAANGYYMIGPDKIDCTQVLFLIATNESKEQLYENFGQRGAKGGGVQRLNMIEFESLDENCCRKIIDDMVYGIKHNLTDSKGRYRVKNVHFPEETLINMANYILNDKLKHARAKFDLEQKIYRLFLYDLENIAGKAFTVNYAHSEQKDKIGNFSKIVGTVNTMPVAQKNPKYKEQPNPNSEEMQEIFNMLESGIC